MIVDYQTLVYVLGIGGSIFGVYSYFRNPQIKAEREDSIMALNIIQLQKDFANLRDNHIHTIDQKINASSEVVSKLALQVERLSTIIEERIPRKK